MVSIITINYNGFKETCELIDSLRLYEDYPYEIIVVDNNSPNGDGRRLKETFPELTIICSDKNLGFSGGNNLGYKYARGEYILYMNNDMTISGPFLKTLVKRFQLGERIGLVSPKIKYEHHPDTIQYAGYTPMHPVRISNNLIGVNQKDKGQYDQPSPTAYAHGGYEIWYEPGAYVLHKESMTAKRGTPLRLYFLTRSRLLFTRRNLASFTKITALLYQLLIVIPKNIILYSAHGQKDMLISFIKGSYHGFTNKINK